MLDRSHIKLSQRPDMTKSVYWDIKQQINPYMTTGVGSSVGRVSTPRSGGTGFDHGPRHTKVVNNGTSCSPLGTRIFGVGLGLVAPVSV